jgi:hypothetical protein
MSLHHATILIFFNLYFLFFFVVVVYRDVTEKRCYRLQI